MAWARVNSQNLFFSWTKTGRLGGLKKRKKEWEWEQEREWWNVGERKEKRVDGARSVQHVEDVEREREKSKREKREERGKNQENGESQEEREREREREPQASELVSPGLTLERMSRRQKKRGLWWMWMLMLTLIVYFGFMSLRERACLIPARDSS